MLTPRILDAGDFTHFGGRAVRGAAAASGASTESMITHLASDFGRARVSALFLHAQQSLLQVAELILLSLRGGALHDPAPHQRLVLCDAMFSFLDLPVGLSCVRSGHANLLSPLSEEPTNGHGWFRADWALRIGHFR